MTLVFYPMEAVVNLQLLKEVAAVEILPLLKEEEEMVLDHRLKVEVVLVEKMMMDYRLQEVAVVMS